VSKKEEIQLSDYQKPDFNVLSVFLDFDLDFNKTEVLSVIKLEKSSTHSRALVLNGEKLKLIKVNINDEQLDVDQYSITDDTLTIPSVPQEFTLSILVEIDPASNFSGEGLYKSGNILCTQNEAQGFRKITYYLDRPDVMAPFTTSIRANKNDFPYVLANGNKLSEKVEGDIQTVVWKDPHPKPCYLFALVAGDLECVRDKFKTMSGNVVDLEIYVDPGNTDKCDHAMESLKNSMKWDEETFGLEYDLDVYMIVAVDSFNMGAMENKGLNIFNSAYVLAKKETATDSDFQGIEAVIAHEYFHNWTGNRVTCRDWFQLTLKEGLTVFRDQEFSSDMLSRSVKRIEDVLGLRRHQYKEDAGPLSHPIQPKSYIEINNFYTSTVYEKGAEVIRMIHTLLGKENFRKGMDLYFERHDGQAVTTLDFVSAMSDASGIDLEQFKLWYDQNGTPELNVESNFVNNSFNVKFIQSSFIEGKKAVLHFPLHIALFNSQGEIIKEQEIEIKDEITNLSFSVNELPTLSLNRNFSAPLNINYDISEADLLHLLKYETDSFTKYDCVQKLYIKELMSLINSDINGADYQISENLLNALEAVLLDDSLDFAFKSYLFSLPSESEINEKFDIYKIDEVHHALNKLKKFIGTNLCDQFIKLYNSIEQKEFSLDARSMGQRQLKNLCLSFIAKNSNHKDIVIKHFESANNMTDEFSSLRILHNHFKDSTGNCMESFYDKWKHETLIMQKWFSIQAAHSDVLIKDLEELENNAVYDAKVPNLIRSVIGAFAGNVYALNKPDGSGYTYLAQKIKQIDSYNPQMAARLSKFLNHKNRLDPKRREKLVTVLESLLNTDLSNDTFEVIQKNLKGN